MRYKEWTQGFSVVELTVTLAIVGLLAAFVSIRVPTANQFDLNSESQNFLNDLQFAKVISMSLNQRHRMVIQSTSYQIQDQTLTPITLPGNTQTTRTLPAGLSFSSTTTLLFDGQGQPRNSTGALFNSRQSITMTDGSQTRTINVEPYTGYIYE